MQTQDPARMACCQDILQVPSSKHDQPAIAHLTVEQTRQLLALPDRCTRQGRRDATLLATLYDTAARVQETADLTVRDVRLEDPPIVALTGKGRKTRHVPIDANTAALLAAYLTERRLQTPGRDDHPVFFNQHHAKLSRGGIAWILRKYQAQADDPTLADAQLSPHVLRHSRAMHLYDAGVPLPYIRDILGHVDLSTTEIYARASTEAKRKALEAVYDQVVSAELTEWNQDPELLNWLTSLCQPPPRYAQRSDDQPPPAGAHASAAHNPALLIWRDSLAMPREHRPLRARRALRRDVGDDDGHERRPSETPSPRASMYRHIRYADDFVVMVSGTEAQAEALKVEIAAVLATVGLRLSEEKTSVCHINEGFDFLGFRIQRKRKRGTNKVYVYSWPSKKALASIMAKVKTITRQGTDQPLSLVLRQLNSALHGWAVYFRHGCSKQTFNYLADYTWLRVWRWLRKKHRRAHWRTIRRR